MYATISGWFNFGSLCKRACLNRSAFCVSRFGTLDMICTVKRLIPWFRWQMPPFLMIAQALKFRNFAHSNILSDALRNSIISVSGWRRLSVLSCWFPRLEACPVGRLKQPGCHPVQSTAGYCGQLSPPGTRTPPASLPGRYGLSAQTEISMIAELDNIWLPLAQTAPALSRNDSANTISFGPAPTRTRHAHQSCKRLSVVSEMPLGSLRQSSDAPQRRRSFAARCPI
jgi:hypothetical protein